MDTAHELLTAFYKKCLSINAETNVTETLEKILADSFVSRGSVETKSKEVLIKQINYFWKLIPDLKWEPQELIKDENKFVVRSIASGTPNGDFMGIKADGTKAFTIMTIDIHTIENDQIVNIYHLEDWGTAIKQLSA